jgi:DNA-directed RNA polymerase specialized sigma24 family protein
VQEAADAGNTPFVDRLATNVALRMLVQRRDRGAPADAHLQPYPDRLLDELPTSHAGPEELATTREGVWLAFVAAMQLLAPKQRAVLVLRDALDGPAREVAELLEDTVPAVNSAPQRARERVGASSRPASSLACTPPRPRRSRRR